jgi:hypothetical protein
MYEHDNTADAPVGTREQVKRLLAVIGHGGVRGAPPPPPIPRDEEAEHAAQLERIIEVRKGRLRNAWHTVPESFRWASFGAMLRSRIKHAVVSQNRQRQYVDPVERVMFSVADVPSMLFLGPSESGKTSLAAACIRHVIDGALCAIDLGMKSPAFRQGCGVMFVTAYDLAKAQIYSPLGRRPELVENAIRSSVLVIDELGMDIDVYRQSATSVREVIHERHSNRRPTILTTYLTKQQLEQQYGRGIANRLGKFKVVLLGPGKDDA